MLLGAALTGGVLMSPSAAQAAPAGANTARAESCPATVAVFRVISSPRVSLKFVDSVLVREEVVNRRLICHFVGTSIVSVPFRPPVVTPNVPWSRPASVFRR